MENILPKKIKPTFLVG